MFDWLKLALLILQLVDKIIDWQHDQGLIDEGRRIELQAQLGRINAKLAVKKQVDDEVDQMSDQQVDEALGNLGGIGSGNPGSARKLHS